MHDFLLAKEIVDESLKIARSQKLEKVDRILLEIGQIAMAHDGHEEHVEDITEENLIFGINTIAKGTPVEGAKIEITKVQGEHWMLKEISGQ